MAFNEELAGRIRQALARRKNVEEKRMFGGIGFLLNGNLLMGVWKESLVVSDEAPRFPRTAFLLRSSRHRFCTMIKVAVPLAR